MTEVRLTLLVGRYAQNYYLSNSRRTVTDTVQNYNEYLPGYFPIVHPSPLNFRWHAKNHWFEEKVIPALRGEVARIINSD